MTVPLPYTSSGPVLVDQFFNDSTGRGAEGEIDAGGPWNESGQWEIIIEAPAFRQLAAEGTETASIDARRTSVALRSQPAPEGMFTCGHP